MATHRLTLGEFETASTLFTAGIKEGMNMHIKFVQYIPHPTYKTILVQTVKCTKGPNLNNNFANLNTPYTGGASYLHRQMNRFQTIHGWKIDAPGERRKCAVFGVKFRKEDNNYNAMWRNLPSPDKGGASVFINPGRYSGSYLRDRPSRSVEANTAFHHEFETVAIRITNNGRFLKILGALTWGYTVNENRQRQLDDCIATSRPSHYWFSAASSWNAGTKPKIPLG